MAGHGTAGEWRSDMNDARALTTIRDTLAAAGHVDVALHLFDELPSTSRWLEAHADASGSAHAASPVLCAVDLQSAGHGRRGKTWVSVRGNVAVSLLEHLPIALSSLGGLSLVTGMAVADALIETTGLDVRVKWPNDVLIGDAKIGGLLMGVQACPAAEAAGPCTRVVSGIGLNVVRDERVSELGIGGTSLASAGAVDIDRDRLVGLVAARVLAAHTRFAEYGWAAFAERWPTLDALAGRRVDVYLGDGLQSGRALGVDADGALRVDIAGVVRSFHGGEVSVRPLRSDRSDRTTA